MKPITNSTQAIRAAWDTRVEDYVAMLSDPSNRGLAAAIELAAFQKHLPSLSNQVILDAGCGPGFHGRHLLCQGHNVTFVDVSPAMLDRARRLTPQSHKSHAFFLQADIRNLAPISDEYFDAIISGGTVISDCGNPQAALAEVSRVLKPNGIFGFSVRNLNGPQQTDPKHPILPAAGPGFDWHFFSPESIIELCMQSNLRCQRFYPVLMEPPVDGPVENAVKRHLSAKETEQWQSKSWEMFVIAVRQTA
ncbi:MAG: class I SAM-dependent methyltransferase [Sedimentisphaerales bacterium]|nr:class I SAM-dependent methyltransferase [Sedimentisphaerales bacterium]